MITTLFSLFVALSPAFAADAPVIRPIGLGPTQPVIVAPLPLATKPAKILPMPFKTTEPQPKPKVVPAPFKPVVVPEFKLDAAGLARLFDVGLKK